MFQKTTRQTNQHLLVMARGSPCLLMAVSNCELSRGESTVAAHSNWADLGGKGMARKASDAYTCWACGPCHSWLDQGGASKAEKRRAWMAGHKRQIELWGAIARSKYSKIEDKKADQWALDMLE
jgi:hypothetical protein